jgi:predicted PurR-regulated permease PerM
MAILRKVKASTLVETLTATVLIVVVFMLTSMILNNLFANSIKNDTTKIDNYLNELEYYYVNDKLSIPYEEEHNTWNITIEKQKERTSCKLEMVASNRSTNKIIIRQLVCIQP